MLKEFRVMLSWAFAVGTVFVLPCCLVWQLDLNPGTTYLDHLPAAISLLGAGLLLLIAPPSATGPDRAVPYEHIDVFRYAIRAGVLPIASLFSDWSGELSRRRSHLKMALRILPLGTGVVCAMDIYGMFPDPGGYVFFLVSALAAMIFGVVAFPLSAVGLQNVATVEERLRLQTELLEMQPWPFM